MGIFHSDIKMDNIFIEMNLKTGLLVEAVIGDFGFACDLTNPEDRFFKCGYLNTRAPEIRGKISPGDSIDRTIFACDVYSMGLVLKELFLGFSNPQLNQL